jgi:hypothetical protein
MKLASAALPLLLATLGALGGCTEKDSTVDLDRALESLRNPTGSFTRDTGSGAFSGYKSEQAESSRVDRPGAGSGSASTQSMRFLTRTLDAKAQCTEGQACACATSGSFTYKQAPSNEGTALHFTFDACKSAEGNTFDGEAMVLSTTKPLLDVEAKTPTKTKLEPAAGEPNLLMTAKGTASDGNQSIALEFALIYEAGYTLLAVEVADGKIVVGVAADGSGFVKAKHGTWSCTPKTKGYDCVSTDGGETVDVEADTSAAATPGASGKTPATPGANEGEDGEETDTIIPGDDDDDDDDYGNSEDGG